MARISGSAMLFALLFLSPAMLVAGSGPEAMSSDKEAVPELSASKGPELVQGREYVFYEDAETFVHTKGGKGKHSLDKKGVEDVIGFAPSTLLPHFWAHPSTALLVLEVLGLVALGVGLKHLLGVARGRNLLSVFGLPMAEDKLAVARTEEAQEIPPVHSMDVSALASHFRTQLQGSAILSPMQGAPLGLHEMNVGDIRAQVGSNKLTPPERESQFILLLKQIFGGLFNIMLWVCVVCEMVLALGFGGDDLLTPVILTLVIVSAGTLQWYTEKQAQMMMEAVQKMQSTEKVTVIRTSGMHLQNSQPHSVQLALAGAELLPGDVILLEPGMRIPADIRVLHCSDQSEVDNAALTGESLPDVRTSKVEAVGSQLMESRNVAFFGTTLLKGKVTGLVFATGDSTVLGQIAAKIRGCRTKSSLEIQIEHFVHLIAVVAIAVGLLSVVANVFSPVHRSVEKILENSATAFFAQVPEGLLPTVTISLMIASRKMASRNVLVRKLDAVETLGCVSVICSDKTGTLTTGEMSATHMVLLSPSQHAPRAHGEVLDEQSHQSLAVQVFALHGLCPDVQSRHPEMQRLAECSLLNSSATKKKVEEGSTEEPCWVGSPTEVALCTAADQLMASSNSSIPALRASHRQIFEVPFNSDNKWMLTVHEVDGGSVTRVVVKGAPERVLDLCTSMWVPPTAEEAAHEVAMTAAMKDAVRHRCEELMAQGRRVLCLMEDRFTVPSADFEFSGSCPTDLSFSLKGAFVGLVGLEDPPKQGVREAVETVQRAGVKVVMVTGDHPATAASIAERLCILSSAEHAQPSLRHPHAVLTGTELEAAAPPGDLFEGPGVDPQVTEFWSSAVVHTRVFARVSPMHKRTIVRAYQHFQQAIVAMTGDGVNDAPALKQAEVGVAMGVRGTEVAKEAADIVLLDDNFASIVSGMEQGRLCSANLQKSIMYTLCSKVPQVLPTFAELAGVPTALTVAQVLLIDIGTDIWTAIAYAMQPAESNLMQETPRNPRKERMVNGRVLGYAYGYIGWLQAISCWFVFFTVVPRMWELFEEGRHYSTYTTQDVEDNYAGMSSYYWTLVLGQVGAALATTTTRQSLFSYGLPNAWLNLCIFLEILLAGVVMYWSPLQSAFKTRSLHLGQLACGALGLVVILALEESRKFAMRSLERSKAQIKA